MRAKTLPLIFVLTVLASCNRKYDLPDYAFLESEDISLSVNNETLLTYSPATWQLSFNKEKLEFRVHNDNMDQYFILSCNQIPTELNEMVKGSINWTTGGAVMSRDALSFQVVKIKEDGRIWLWNKSKSIAVCVKTLR